MNKNFLVTGGTGFIGSSICELLVKRGHRVTVLDNNSRGSLKRLLRLNNNIKFIKGDIRDKSKVFKSLKNINAVIHLAYINGTKYFYEKPDLILDVAVKGLVNIFDGCKKYNIKELYLASSSEVYQTPLKVPTNEDEPLKVPDINNPRYSYGGGKILTELMGVHYGKKFFKKLIIFRPHNVYGADMGNEHVIPEIISKLRKIKNNKILKIQGTGNEIRSFIYIKDFVKAFNVLTAVYFPDKDIEIPEKLSLVNLYRIFFNTYFDTDYEILEDRHIWYNNIIPQPYVHIDITDKLNSLT